MKKPNIIFMMTDDQRYDTFGFMGNKHAYTPNIDKMAKEGSYFNNAFHVAPICMPSRASVQLGQYISEHRCGFDSPTDYTVTYEEYQNSYPALLRKNGYYTGFIGKFGFAVTKEKMHDGTCELVMNDRNEPRYPRNNCWSSLEEGMPKKEFHEWYGFPKQGEYLPNKETNTFNGYDNTHNCEHLTMFNAHQAVDFIKNATDKNMPFALSISFKAPHRPFIPSQKWIEYYKDLDYPRYENDKPEYFEVLPTVVKEHSRNAEEYWGRYSSSGIGRPWKEDEFFKEDARRYLGLISGVDEAVGIIRDYLDEQEIADNTILIYTSDNGFFFGSKQIGGKELLYEESIRAPFIVYDPTRKKVKDTIDGLMSHVDICPTILDFAGIEKPMTTYGTSILPLLDGSCEQINDAVYGENDFDNFYTTLEDSKDPENYQSIRSKYVRTTQYKYIKYHECHPVVEELWEIDKDPLESKNLINDPNYKEITMMMREKLAEFESRVLQ